jgi:hypothetical protein
MLVTPSDQLSVHQSHDRGSFSILIVFLYSAENNVKHNETAPSGPQTHYLLRWIITTIMNMRPRSSVVGWGIMLKVGRLRVRLWLIIVIFNWPNFPAALWPWDRLSFWHEWVPENLLGVKGRPARKADKLTAICEPIAYRKCRSLNIS